MVSLAGRGVRDVLNAMDGARRGWTRGRIGRYDVVPTFVNDLLSLTNTTTAPDDDGCDGDDEPVEALGMKKIRKARGAGAMFPMDNTDLLCRMRIATTTPNNYHYDDAARLEKDGRSSLSSFYFSLRTA